MTNKQIANSFVDDKNIKNSQLTSKATLLPQNDDSGFDTFNFDPREIFDSLSSPQNLANEI